MKTIKIRVIIILLATAVILHAVIENTYPYYNPSPITPPFEVPPPWFPHGFPNVWSPDDVIKVLNERGLAVSKTSETLQSHDNLPADAKEIVNFSETLSGKEWEGTILSFELKDNLNKVQKYYLDLNETGKLYTWSFQKGNILLVLPGSIAEEKARQYEKALNSMKIK